MPPDIDTLPLTFLLFFFSFPRASFERMLTSSPLMTPSHSFPSRMREDALSPKEGVVPSPGASCPSWPTLVETPPILRFGIIVTSFSVSPLVPKATGQDHFYGSTFFLTIFGCRFCSPGRCFVTSLFRAFSRSMWPKIGESPHDHRHLRPAFRYGARPFPPRHRVLREHAWSHVPLGEPPSGPCLILLRRQMKEFTELILTNPVTTIWTLFAPFFFN